MSNIINFGSMSMSSLEIADLVESRHDNVRVTIQRLAEKGVITLPATQEKPTAGRPTQVYVFSGEQGKRDSIIVVAQLSPEFTARLVDRWQELEAKEAPALNPANMSRLQLIQIAMEAEQEKLALEAVVADQAPKVEVHDRIADAEGSLTIRESANTLRIPERKFVLWLQQNDWVYRRAGHKSLLGYAEKVKAGYLYLKQTPIRDMHTGEERLSEQVRITPLGLTVLARRLSKEGQQVDIPPGMLPDVGANSYAAMRG